MKKNHIVTAGAIAIFVGLLLFINRLEPTRVSEQRKKEAAQAQAQVDAQGGSKGLESIIQKSAEGVSQKLEATMSARAVEAVAETTAEVFQVEFVCSNGTFIVEVHPEWSPLGSAQFRAAIEDGVYTEARFFRVVPGFIVQCGIPADPEKSAAWEQRNIKDEPVRAKNLRGTVTFAKSGMPDSRTTQIFVNIGNNERLDAMGFAPFGKVVKGLEVIDEINAEYGESPEQEEMESRGNAYLKENYPRLDYIKEVKILGPVPAAAPVESTAQAQTAPAEASPPAEIGRASCRERV
jgi:cyclophilin family peptidyl-prolyl cis-trans isomerase